MKRFRNVTDHHVDVPAYDLRVGPDETFEVPDDAAASFESSPFFKASRTQHPTATVDAAVAETVTGPITVAHATPAAADDDDFDA